MRGLYEEFSPWTRQKYIGGIQYTSVYKYESSENSLFEMGPSEVTGVGNYQINIADSSGEIIRALIMPDSHSKTRYETGRDYDYI